MMGSCRLRSFDAFGKLAHMSDSRKIVFVSCGQYTYEEKELGKRICKLVDECSPFQGYFAENQTTLRALSENVLRRLYESVGLVVVMHHRGAVEVPDRKIVRASVWIEQEIAIATLMEQILGRPLHVALFVQTGIAVEGIRQQLQLNAIHFESGDEVIAQLREILPGWTQALYASDGEVRKMVESVDPSIALSFGMRSSVTIDLENHSDNDIEVESVLLWSKESRLCKPALPNAGIRWTIPARRFVPIQFLASDDIVRKLASIHQQSPPVGALPRIFNAAVKVDLRCKIQGIGRKFEEVSSVQVDYRSGTINKL